MDQMRMGNVYTGNILDAIIVGCGALGSEVALRIAKLGINVTLIDFDVIESHNVPNQFLYGPKDVGQKKVHVLAQRIQELTDVSVKAIDDRVTATTLLRADAVFACVDSMSARSMIHAAAVDGHCRYLFDGRIGARTGTAIGIYLPRESHHQEYVGNWLYPDEDVVADRAPCGTILSIGATASLCASYLVWQFINLTSQGISAADPMPSDHICIRRPVQTFNTEEGTSVRLTL